MHRSYNSDGGCAVIEGMEYGRINTKTDREPRIGIPLVRGLESSSPSLLTDQSSFSDLRGVVTNPGVSDSYLIAVHRTWSSAGQAA